MRNVVQAVDEIASLSTRAVRLYRTFIGSQLLQCIPRASSVDEGLLSRVKGLPEEAPLTKALRLFVWGLKDPATQLALEPNCFASVRFTFEGKKRLIIMIPICNLYDYVTQCMNTTRCTIASLTSFLSTLSQSKLEDMLFKRVKALIGWRTGVVQMGSWGWWSARSEPPWPI
jgi:hypothetical protein